MYKNLREVSTMETRANRKGSELANSKVQEVHRIS